MKRLLPPPDATDGPSRWTDLSSRPSRSPLAAYFNAWLAVRAHVPELEFLEYRLASYCRGQPLLGRRLDDVIRLSNGRLEIADPEDLTPTGPPEPWDRSPTSRSEALQLEADLAAADGRRDSARTEEEVAVAQSRGLRSREDHVPPGFFSWPRDRKLRPTALPPTGVVLHSLERLGLFLAEGAAVFPAIAMSMGVDSSNLGFEIRNQPAICLGAGVLSLVCVVGLVTLVDHSFQVLKLPTAKLGALRVLALRARGVAWFVVAASLASVLGFMRHDVAAGSADLLAAAAGAAAQPGRDWGPALTLVTLLLPVVMVLRRAAAQKHWEAWRARKDLRSVWDEMVATSLFQGEALRDRAASARRERIAAEREGERIRSQLAALVELRRAEEERAGQRTSWHTSQVREWVLALRAALETDRFAFRCVARQLGRGGLIDSTLAPVQAGFSSYRQRSCP